MRARRGLITFVAWLALTGLIATMAYMTLRGCGLRIPGGPVILALCEAEAAEPDPDLLAEQARAERLGDQVRRLERLLALSPACPIPEPVEQAEVPPEEPEPPPPEPEPEPEPEPVEVAETVDPEPEPEPEPPPPEPEPEPEPLAACPQVRPTEVVLMLDASTSMQLDFALPAAVEEELDRLSESVSGRPTSPFGALSSVGDRARLQRMLSDLEASPGVDRIDVAKQSLTELVRTSPGDVSFSFVSFAQCNNPRFHGNFSPGQRTALVSQIQGARLDNYTALGDAISSLPGVIRGGRTPDDPVNVVLVSDGRDSCGDNPCAAAAAIARQFPHVAINVIAMSRSLGPLRCIPEVTGGQFYTADNVQELARQLTGAAGQDLPEHCR